jgi:TolB-like protein/DNA-binding winged helix-turn-helix (wHTH) protein
VEAGFHVGRWRVEPGLNTVSHNGTTVRLKPKAMQVLVCLVEHAGDAVTREELFQAVWPDTFVSDDVLKHSISELRQIFEDDSREPQVIQTIPKRGYRLVASVERTNGAGLASKAPTQVEKTSTLLRSNLRIGTVLALIATVLVVALVGSEPARLWHRLSGKTEVPQIRSIAVLPLKNLSGDPEQKYFAEGMTEELITDLSQISSLKVISRTSSEVYEDTHKSLPQIARELNVDAIVEGSVQRSGDRVHITAQLIYAPEDKNVWAQTYERDVQSALTLQSEVAAAIVGEVRTQVTPREAARLHGPRPVNLKALEAYMQGNYHFNKKGKGSGDDENREAAKYFEEAIASDPGFAPAYIALANTHEGLLRPSMEDLVATKAALKTALSLDPVSADAHTLLGDVKVDEWDWADAEEEYRRAIELNANSMQSHLSYGWFLQGTGRFTEAMPELQRAQEIDPNKDHISGILFALGEHDRAIELKRRAVESDPENGYLHYEFSDMLASKGDYQGWVKEMEQFVTLFGFPELAGSLEDAFNRKGYRGALEVWAANIERIQGQGTVYTPLTLADVYAALGNKDRAFYWLEDAYQHYRWGYSDPADGGMLWIKANGNYAPIRSDPRFKDLLRRVGLPQ